MRKLSLLLGLALAGLAVLALPLAPAAQAASKGKVELVYVEWDSEIASTNVIGKVLEDLGYDVELTPVSAAAMWQAVASGDADGMVAAWLPTTHGHYLKKVADKVVDLGPNLKGTRIGLVAPDYVTIDSIDQLNANADKFNGKIIGIDPGAGLMSKTEKVMKDYNLDKMELVEGSGATMTAALADAIKNKEWIVVTGWTPHWMFAKWPLKYLKDPKGIYGGEEFIGTIVRKGLKEDQPEVYKVLDNFSWTPADMAEVMIWNREKGAKPAATAARWVKENPDKVKAWTK
ncbi:MAG: glycine betaine ABC transporter substrate-binding protein [Deltaproteobacteria bacterium]|nr:glycine betaine ABC transporter substrate-binding protein [Deltaproteobacteria bacterium]